MGSANVRSDLVATIAHKVSKQFIRTRLRHRRDRLRRGCRVFTNPTQVCCSSQLFALYCVLDMVNMWMAPAVAPLVGKDFSAKLHITIVITRLVIHTENVSMVNVNATRDIQEQTAKSVRRLISTKMSLAS